MKPLAIAAGIVATIAAGVALMRHRASAAPPAALPQANDPPADEVESYGFVATVPQTGDANVSAFLALISYSEGTDRAADPYRVCFGYRHTIADLSDHPAVTGEWLGEPIGDGSGRISTAAGRYQILKASWLEGKAALGLRDFSAASQDAWAVWRIARRSALDAVKDGRIADAIELCRREWASLPGAGYGQPERRLSALLDKFADAGGTIA